MGLLDGIIGDVLTTLSDTKLFGVSDVRLVQPKGSYSPTQGVEVVKTADSWPVTPFPPQGYQDKEIDGESIMAGDQKFLLPATRTPVEPRPGMLLIFKGEVLRIITVDKTYPGDGVAGYTLQCRK